MPEAVFLVDMDSDRDTIRDALTTQNGITSWWTNDAIVTPDTLDLGFPDVPARFELTVESVTDDHVRWLSAGDFPPHWRGTTVAWQLMEHPAGAGSQVFFTHAGFAGSDPMLGHTSYTWALLMGHLKAYVELGTANPFFA